MKIEETLTAWGGGHPRSFQLFELAYELGALAYRPTPTTADEVGRLRRRLEQIERALQTEERRARQAVEMDEKPDEPVRWFGDIVTFAEDMAFHAKRTGRVVRGLFNGNKLVATPGGTAEDVAGQWDAAVAAKAAKADER
jgi:hypothetical protein